MRDLKLNVDLLPQALKEIRSRHRTNSSNQFRLSKQCKLRFVFVTIHRAARSAFKVGIKGYIAVVLTSNEIIIPVTDALLDLCPLVGI